MAFPESSEVAQAIETSESAPTSAAESGSAPETQTTQTPSIAELDKLEKFKFEGQEYTPQELKRAILRQQDYTRKTQEFAQDRKFYDNLNADLRHVRNNPALAAEFRRTYPEKFHQYLEHFTSQSGNTSQQSQEVKGSQSSYAQLDPELISRFEKVENTIFEKDVAAIETQLETQEREFSSKYPMADLETVYAKAQAFLDRNKELPKDQHVKLDKEVWDRLYKSDHDKNQKRYENYYKENINKQKQAGLRGKDAGTGGGTPSGAPKTFKSIKDATNAALADLDS